MYSLHFLIIYIKNNTGNSTQYTVIAYMGKESKKKWIYVYGKLVHFVVHLKHNIANQVDYNKNENKTKHETQTNKNNTYPIWFSFEEEKSIYLERSTCNIVGHLKRCCVMWSVAQSCPILCSPKDCNQPGSSIHGLFQARILQRVANSYSRESYWFMMKSTSLCLCVGRWVLCH